MRISTTRFGELEIGHDKVITMPDCMIGFSERRFTILNPDKGGGFCWFQSIDNPGLAFVVVDPVQYVPDYQVKLTSEEYSNLLLKPGEPIVLLTVVTMAADPRLITTNLQGPIVINPAQMTAIQVVMDGNHATWHRLFAPRESEAMSQSLQTLPMELYKVSSSLSSMRFAAACQ